MSCGRLAMALRQIYILVPLEVNFLAPEPHKKRTMMS